MSDPYKPWKEKTRWEKLRWHYILGVVDSYDVVDSKLTEELEHHADFWPSITHCRWRWDYSTGLHWFLSISKPTTEQMDLIRNHLTKKYGIEWQENGYHDWNYILDKLEPEDDSGL